MSPQSKLLASITRVDLHVKKEQLKLTRHKQYFKGFVREYRVAIGVLYLSTFYAGWRMAKNHKFLSGVKQIAKLASINALRVVGKRLLA